MAVTREHPRDATTSRRSLLGVAGTAVLGGALPGLADGWSADGRDGRDDAGLVLRQGDRCRPVTPLSGGDPVEALYDYRLAETRYSAAGAAHLQQADGSVLFAYRGPDGLSLVAIHGKLDGGGDGGSVSFAVDGLPEGGSWVVRDDDYDGPSNYDRWEVGGGSARIDWTWAGGRTDGGAFRGLGGEFSVTVTPAFDEAAALFGEHYDGRVDSWEFLTGDLADPGRIALRMDRPVTLETGGCDDGSTTTTTRRPTTEREDEDDDDDGRDDEDDREDDEREHDDRDEHDDDDDRDDDERDERDERDDDREDGGDDEREEAHERRAEKFEGKAEDAREKAERKAERFEEKAEERASEQAEKFEEKAERARRKGERKAEKFERKAERADEKADRDDDEREEREEDEDDDEDDD